jgi:hypothetical protein
VEVPNEATTLPAPLAWARVLLPGLVLLVALTIRRDPSGRWLITTHNFQKPVPVSDVIWTTFYLAIAFLLLQWFGRFWYGK